MSTRFLFYLILVGVFVAWVIIANWINSLKKSIDDDERKTYVHHYGDRYVFQVKNSTTRYFLDTELGGIVTESEIISRRYYDGDQEDTFF